MRAIVAMRWWMAMMVCGWPALAAAQSDPCPAAERWSLSGPDTNGAVTLTYASPTTEPIVPHVEAVAWRAATPGAVELLAIGHDVFARCADATVRRVAPLSPSLRPIGTTHEVNGHAWPDLVQHAARGWVADVHWIFDGTRYVLGRDGSHCAGVTTPGAFTDGGAPESPYAELPLGPGEWIDASAEHSDEVFRVPLAADPAMLAVGLADGHDEAMLVILAPEDGGHCVVGVWDWSFGGNGVEFGDLESPGLEQAATQTAEGSTSVLLVAMTAHYHGGCEEDGECPDDPTAWFVLAVTRTRVVVAARDGDRGFRSVARARVRLVDGGIAIGARRFAVDATTLRLRAGAPRQR